MSITQKIQSFEARIRIGYCDYLSIVEVGIYILLGTLLAMAAILGVAGAFSLVEGALRNWTGTEAIFELIDRLLRGARPHGYAMQPRNHNAVAAAVKQGRADWGMTLDTIACQAGLGFLPVQVEQYDFIVPASRAGRPAVAAFRMLLQQTSTREALARLGMRL